MAGIWSPPRTENENFFAGLNSQILELEHRNPNLLPDLRRGRTMFVASDYAGERDRFQILSLLFTDNEQAVRWEDSRQSVRTEMLPDRRSMAFKKLNDKIRKRALMPFLTAANRISGLSLTIVVDSTAPFQMSALQGVGRDSHPYRNAEVREKMFRVVNFLGFFVAGLSQAGQNLLWISDNDAIAANAQQREHLINTFKEVSGRFLMHEKMGEFQFVATGDDDDLTDRQFEDYAAIPDLVAGSLCEIWNAATKENVPLVMNVATILPAPSAKTQSIMEWFSDKRHPLKRLVLRISPDSSPSSFQAGFVDFSSLSA